MGFIKNLKGIWNPKSRAESVIETQISIFNTYRFRYPERDINAWLAETLKRRPSWGFKYESLYYTATSQFSVLDINTAPIALGLFILHKEEPGLAAIYENNFNQIMEPYFLAVTNGCFIKIWKEKNPWTLTYYPDVLTSLLMTEDADSRG